MGVRVRAVIETLALSRWVLKTESRCRWMISRDVCKESSEKGWRQHEEGRLAAGGFAVVVVGMHGCLASVIRHSARLGSFACFLPRKAHARLMQERTCTCGPLLLLLFWL
jgi:hypothetical protein